MENKTHILEIRDQDRVVFDYIKSGEKKIEFRAGGRYEDIQVGDTIVFRSGNDQISKIVSHIDKAVSIDDLLSKYSLNQIAPWLNSVEEFRATFESFPGYKERVNQFGILAFHLE